MTRLRGLSLFASAGIGETYLPRVGVDIVVANELIPKRANLYRNLYPNCQMICGDITDKTIYDDIMKKAKGIEFIIASPPCQGMSIAGKNRHLDTMVKDNRNYLITYVFSAIKELKPKYVLIENVPMLLKILLPYKNGKQNIIEILDDMFADEYDIEGKIIDSSDLGVPQTRLRAIIKMCNKSDKWNWPQPVKKKVTVREAIGNLPSLESGEKSSVKWHFARKHDKNNVLWMKHTPTGKSAFSNAVYYPQKKDGTRIKGYESSYRRIKWDEPAPTITIRNDCIASQRNVHPGRLLADGTYSDARVLTPLELMILNSLPADWNIPDDTPEILIRQVIGESIPPLMIERIVGEIGCLKK
ncbi:MAG: DNA cytosine methyltransferase [Ruminococcus sp.]|nr:DNA cytosine methyltransferase [Ruminococcus sp.]